MANLDFSKASKSSLTQLSKISAAIDGFCKKHPKDLTSRQHKKLRSMLSKRASALSECLGTKVHSLFD